MVSTILLRTEGAGSSFIEGVAASAKAVAKALEFPGFVDRDEAFMIAQNIDATYKAMEIATQKNFTVDLICDLHKALLSTAPANFSSGSVRLSQNWIGGSPYGPKGAEYIPPPPEYINDLLKDLVAFCNRRNLSPLTSSRRLKPWDSWQARRSNSTTDAPGSQEPGLMGFLYGSV